jgi:hypothetical protein
MNVFRALSWGYNRPFTDSSEPAGAVLWFHVKPTGALHVLAELMFSALTEEALATEMHVMDRTLQIGPPVSYTVATPAIFLKKPAHYPGFVGKSIAEALADAGVWCVPADEDEVNGWARIHARLRPSPSAPWLTVSNACTHLIKSMGSALSKDTNPDALEIHLPAVTALRYGVMSRPSPAVDAEQSATIPFGSPAYYMQRERAALTTERLFGQAK